MEIRKGLKRMGWGSGVKRAVLCAFVLCVGQASASATEGSTGDVRSQGHAVGAAALADTASRSGFVGPTDVGADVAEQPQRELERGEALLRLGRLDDAARAFRRVIQVQGENLLAYERLRNAYVRAQRVDGLADLLATIAGLYLRRGDRGMATKRFDELVALAPAHPARHVLEEKLGRLGTPARGDPLHIGSRARCLFGIFVLLGIAFVLSDNRRAVKARVVLWGMGLQVVFAMLILWTPPGRWVFDVARRGVQQVISFTDTGAVFLFGTLYGGLAPGPTSGPMQLVDGTTGDPVNLGMIFVFHVLPTIIFFASLMSVLYHFGVIQRLVRGIAWLMSRTMGTSGAESLSAAGNIFVGQTEAPLLIKPYVANMTRSELMAVMCGGFATIAGGVLAAYVRFGIDAGHLLAASVMSAPASLAVAKILCPECEEPATMGGHVVSTGWGSVNVIDAATNGAIDGLRLAVNVGAIVMAFIALTAGLDWVLGFVGLSLHRIFGWLFLPLSWCMGVDTQDLFDVGHLLGTKVSINEFVAYVDLSHLKNTLTERSSLIATYALCGFANLSAIGVQIGGIGSIAPQRRADLARIGLRAMIGGALASWLTACVAGVLL